MKFTRDCAVAGQIVLALAALLFQSAPADAGLIGQDVNVLSGYIANGIPTVIDSRKVKVVTPGAELINYLGLLDANIEDHTIGLAFIAPFSFAVPPSAHLQFYGIVFKWHSPGPQLTGIGGVYANIPGFNPARVIRFDSSTLGLNFLGLTVNPNLVTNTNNLVLIDMNLKAVPEPPAAWMIVLGLTFLAAMRSAGRPDTHFIPWRAEGRAQTHIPAG